MNKNSKKNKKKPPYERIEYTPTVDAGEAFKLFKVPNKNQQLRHYDFELNKK